MLETTKQTIETIIDTFSEYDLYKDRFIFADGREYSSDKPETGEYTELKTSNGVTYYDRGTVEFPNDMSNSNIWFNAVSIKSKFIYGLINKNLVKSRNYYIHNFFDYYHEIGCHAFRMVHLSKIDSSTETHNRNQELMLKLIDYMFASPLPAEDATVVTNGKQYQFYPKSYAYGHDELMSGVEMTTPQGNKYYDYGDIEILDFDEFADLNTITIVLPYLEDLAYAPAGTEEADLYWKIQDDIDEICKPYGLYLEFGFAYTIELFPLNY